MKPLTIAVVGRGVAGMAAALFLNRAGHRVHIFEEFPEAQPRGAGLLLQPTGQAALARLGLLDASLECGARIGGIDGRSPRGRRVLMQTYRDRDPEFFGLGIQRGALFGLLYQAVNAATIAVATSRKVVSARTVGGQAFLTDDQRRDEGPFDLVLVADGASSDLRAAGPPPRRDKTYAWGAMWCLCDLPPDWPGNLLSQTYCLNHKMIGVLPVGTLPVGAPDDAGQTPQASFFWSLKVAEMPAWRDAGLETWKDEVRALWPAVAPVLDGIRSMDQFQPATYKDCYIPMPWRGRVALIGDAAHAMSPQFGQGANMALVDAALLADALAENGAIEAMLAQWWRWRRPHVLAYQRLSRWFTPVFQGDQRIWGWLRDILLPLACRTPVVKQRGLAMMTGIQCGWLGTLDPLTLRPRNAGIGRTKSL